MSHSLQSDPTELESAVARLAADLKVAGMGQRTRAALRRNQDANDDTFLPYAKFKDIPGPDLVRHQNAAFIAGLAKTGGELHFGSADDQLVAVMQKQLVEVRRFVARLWDGPLTHIAAAFVDYDNLPVPFCPMYPNARELLGDDLTLPHQLERILEQLREVLYRTEALTAALEHSAAADPDVIARLAAAKKAMTPKLQVQPPESVLQWNQRASRLIAAARNEVPPPLLVANNLINATVGSLVSLAVWNHSLSHDDVLGSACWPDAERSTENEDDSHDQNEAMGFVLPPLPRGHRLQIKFNPALFAPMDTAIRLQHGEQRQGIVILKGLSMSWSQGEEVDFSLDVVRLADYESCDPQEMSK